MKTQQRLSLVTVLLFLLLSAGLLIAQDQDNAPPPAQQGDSGNYPTQQIDAAYPAQQGDNGGQASQQQDPPGRVARVQYMSGQVSMQPGGVNDWIAASQNRPLTTADRIWTDKDSRAELNVGDGFIRMNSETSLTLTNVSDQNVQLELDQGILNISVRHLAPGEIYEVDTPNYAFTVMKPGVYRFDVYPGEDQSWVTVRSGYGEATGRGSAVRVNSGEQIRFTAGNSLQHTAESAPARDGFDDWARVRDKRLEDSVSGRYVSPGVIGYQDLDAYGRWVPAPQYGNVWVPASVPPGWAPYRFGHWVWIAPWGWTWVDDQPWGFAPFHYGRWVAWGGGWAWAPGPVGYWNPYYAPALVGWIGGPGFGIGFGFGSGWGIGINVGWFPLGWGEPFYPRYCGWGHGGWYRGGGWVSNNYVRNVNITNTNITNITNITNNYRSGNVNAARYGFRNRPGAVTAAPGSAFASGAAINRVGGAVPRADLGKGAMLRGVDVTPTRQSVLGGHTPQTRGVPPASAFGRSVVTANRGPAMRPANLEAANQATTAHGNVNAPTRGGAGNNPARTPVKSGANNPQPNNGRGNAPINAARGGASAAPGRGAPAATNDQRASTPTSMGGRYVPRPPSAGGNPNSGYRSGNTSAPQTPTAHPYQGNGNVGPGNAPRPIGGGNASNTAPPKGNYGAPAQRPPQTTAPSQGRTSPPTITAPHEVAPIHPAPPVQSGAPKATPRTDSSHGPSSAMSGPRPPTYSYHPAPYSASAGSGATRQPSGYYGSQNRAPAPSYNPGRSSVPSYSPNRGYTPSSPAYRPSPATRSYPSGPVYANRGTGGYSAPRPSGGGGGYRAPSGGGGVQHSSGGGGSHSAPSGGGHQGR